jgi:hypothetical protein
MAVFHDRAITADKQNGLFDSNILCKICDNEIGKVDKWFTENFQIFHDLSKELSAYSTFEVPIDPIMAIRFGVSVIYRSSLSRIEQFARISLGPYSEIAGQIATGKIGAHVQNPVVLINTLISNHLDTRQFAFYPVRCAGGNGIYFVFALSGLQYLVKFGGVKMGVTPDDQFSANLTIGQNLPVKSVCCPFEDSAEADFMFKVARSSK